MAYLLQPPGSGSGAQGPAGPAGPQGPQGPAGTTGPAGPTGAAGPQGPQGPQGPAGTTGPAGATGAAGPQGQQGVAGTAGTAGTAGATGPQGPQGPAGPTGGANLPVAITFSGTVPFTQNAVMPRQQVRNAVAFAPNASGAVMGATVETSLVADGTNAPSFSGFKEWGGSAGYLNTAGTVNYVQFRFDGLDYTYSVVQVINPVAAPVLTGTAANSGQNTITLTYSKALNAAQVPASSAFTLTNSGGAQTVSNVAIAGSTVTLTTSRTMASTDAVALAYTPPATTPVASSDGENAGAVAAFAVPVATLGAPSNTVAPTLSSATAITGTALTVTTGTWSNSPTGFTYQWSYADTSTAIGGATASSYIPVAGDVGHTLKCIVTATNPSGSAAAASNTSSAVTAAAAPVNTVNPALSTTTPAQGAAISVTTGTWNGSPTGFAYQWAYADTSAAISGATASSYTPVAGDVGHTLKCTVTATNANGSAAAVSNTSGAVTATAAATFARYTALNPQMLETVNGGGYNYGTAVGGQNFAGGFGTGVTGTKLSATTAAGYHAAKVAVLSGSGGCMIGLQIGAAAAGYQAIKYGLYTDGTSGNWKIVSFGSGNVAAQVAMAIAANDFARVRKGSGNIFAEVSKDSGTTWTTIYTWTAVASEDLYAIGLADEIQEIVQPQTLGFA